MALKLDDLNRLALPQAYQRTMRVFDKIESARRRIAAGKGVDLDSGPRRLKASLREKELSALQDEVGPPLIATPGLGAEAYIGPRNNILSSEFLEIGLLAARTVCRISRGVESGTGFLVGEGVVATNAHVLASKGQAQQATFDFLFEDNSIGTPQNTMTYIANPDRFFFADVDLDIAFVALHEAEYTPKLVSYGWLPLIREEGKILIGDPVNILQHPKGLTKRITIHESVLAHLENGGDVENFCWYTGDTEKGSSGSPVMNSKWEVVAVHHEAIPATDKNGHVLDMDGKRISAKRKEDPDLNIQWIANEGIRVSRIVNALEAAELSDSEAEVRQTLLQLWGLPLARRAGWVAALAGSGG